MRDAIAATDLEVDRARRRVDRTRDLGRRVKPHRLGEHALPLRQLALVRRAAVLRGEHGDELFEDVLGRELGVGRAVVVLVRGAAAAIVALVVALVVRAVVCAVEIAVVRVVALRVDDLDPRVRLGHRDLEDARHRRHRVGFRIAGQSVGGILGRRVRGCCVRVRHRDQPARGARGRTQHLSHLVARSWRLALRLFGTRVVRARLARGAQWRTEPRLQPIIIVELHLNPAAVFCPMGLPHRKPETAWWRIKIAPRSSSHPTTCTVVSPEVGNFTNFATLRCSRSTSTKPDDTQTWCVGKPLPVALQRYICECHRETLRSIAKF